MGITPIIKVVGMDCNLRCGYCYYADPYRTNAGEVISLGLVEQILRIVRNSSRRGKARIIWHGGEPMLAGLEFYQEVIAIQKRLSENGFCFTNSIQTNGILLNGEWLEFLAKHQFRLGISLDGPQDIHDAYRMDVDEEGSFSKVISSVELCLEMPELHFGCLCVLTDKSVGRAQEIFDFFVQTEITKFRVKPCYEVHSETGQLLPCSIQPEEYAAFLVALFDTWITYDNPNIECGPVDDYLRGLLGKEPHQCTFSRHCSRYWSIWPNGDVYHCEFGFDPRMYVGNLLESSGEELLAAHAALPIQTKIRELRQECSRCPWLTACKGGCPRYGIAVGEETNLFCKERKKVYTHIQRYLRQTA